MAHRNSKGLDKSEELWADKPKLRIILTVEEVLGIKHGLMDLLDNDLTEEVRQMLNGIIKLLDEKPIFEDKGLVN